MQSVVIKSLLSTWEFRLLTLDGRQPLLELSVRLARQVDLWHHAEGHTNTLDYLVYSPVRLDAFGDVFADFLMEQWLRTARELPGFCSLR